MASGHLWATRLAALGCIGALALMLTPSNGRATHLNDCGDADVGTAVYQNIKANFNCAFARKVVKNAECVDVPGGCDKIRYRKFRGRRITLDANTSRVELHHDGKKVTCIVHTIAD